MKTIKIRSIIVAQSVLDLLPAQLAKRLLVLPLAIKDDQLHIALSPDKNHDHVIEQVENLTNMIVVPVLAESEEILKKSIARYYAKAHDQTQESAATLFERILNRALQLRASDIHLSPTQVGGLVKFRIDGQLMVDSELSSGLFSELTTVVKISAKLDIAERRTPLDGNINITLLGDKLSLRVATIPTLYGEHITLRLLSQNDSSDLDSMEHLGMNQVHLDLFKRVLSEPNGIVFLSGPTGSGKTTTLYAALRYLREKGNRHLVSIEDPVEKPVSGVTQIKIDADSERVTFNKALRSVLRHDPDVLMIGEIRDAQTADIAVKSALTGHLVLSTLHTHSAAGVLTRLVNLDVPSFLVGTTLKLAIAQRLVRVPCAYCVKRRAPTQEEIDFFEFTPEEIAQKVPHIKGCSFCGDTGYAGRTAIYEMIVVDQHIRRLLLNGGDENDFSLYAFNTLKLPSLKSDAKAKILAGMTSVEEALTIISSIL